MKYCFSVIIALQVLVPISASACSCGTSTLIDALANTQFAAVIKINRVLPDSLDPLSRVLEIKVVELFKGTDTSRIRVVYGSDAYCGLITPPNSVWLVFAHRNLNGQLSFSLCSYHLRLDNISNVPKYQQSVDRKLGTLRFLRDNKLVPANPNKVHMLNDSCLAIFKGMKPPASPFAVYRVKMTKASEIISLMPVKEFSETDFIPRLSACIKKRRQVKQYEKGALLPETEQLLVLFYYPAEKQYQSFISTWDL